MIYIVCGHLGSGKTLLTVRLAQRYMQEGRRVASNITLRPDKLVHRDDKQIVTKLPYIPTAQHLKQIGAGYESGPDDYDENRFGLVILDEAGTWLNSRNWQDKERLGLFQWITHARKSGWDVALIIQDFESLDAQIRRSICELYVECNRTDRIKIPYLPLKMPRMHAAVARYKGPTGTKADSWWTRGTDLFGAFRTREAVHMEEVVADDGTTIDIRANVSLLSAWHVHGRYLPPKASLRMWADFIGKSLTAVVLLLVASGARRAAIKQALGDDFSQLMPMVNPERSRAVFADRKKPRIQIERSTPPLHPSRLLAHSMHAYRVKRLAGVC